MHTDKSIGVGMDHQNILDGIEELVYVSDIQTHELLYVNKAMAAAFKLQRNEIVGRKCYEVIQGFDSPCEFCTNDKLCKGRYYTWTIHNRNLDRTFKVSDSLIDYNGKNARLEIATDINDYVSYQGVKREQQFLNKFFRRMISLLNCPLPRFKKLLGEILNEIMHLTGGTRVGTFIFDKNKETVSLYVQRVAKGTVEVAQKDLSLTSDYVQHWMPRLMSNSDIYVQDFAATASEHSKMAAFIRNLHINSFYWHPLWFDNELIGVMVIDGPEHRKLLRVRERLHNIAPVIAGAIGRQLHYAFLEKAVYTDIKTGLFNRAGFMRNVENLKYVNLGLIVVDINGLKTINEEFGHDKGDEILEETAKLITQLYDKDHCYRLGDDEFVVVLPNISDQTFSENLFTVKSLFSGGLGFSASVGGLLLDGRQNLLKALSLATNMMLDEKQNYYLRNPVGPRYRPSYDQILSRLSHPHTIKKLIDNGNFFPYIQPIYDTQGHLVKGESLVRLNYHGNLIEPNRFIPILESMNMTQDIDYHIFKTACKLLAQRAREGYRIYPLSTNFSRYTITAPDFVDKIESIVAQESVDKSFLYLEVTESAEEREHQALIDVTRDLSEKGYQVAVDDFGVANANILTFISISMNTVKFDKKLIDALSYGNKAFDTLKAFIDLLHSRGIKAVAEGVEHQDQVDLLKDLGVDYLQGYFFSRPLPVDDFIKLCDAENEKRLAASA